MKLTWVPPTGSSIVFSRDATDYKLMKNYDGLSMIPVQHIAHKAPYQDGQTLLSSQLETRHVSFEILILASSLTELQTRVGALGTALNPTLGTGTLIYEQESGTQYRLDCIGNNTPTLNPTQRGLTWQRATIDFIAFDPCWYSNTSSIQYLIPSPKTFFPFTFPFDSLTAAANTNILMNNGTMETPVIIIIFGDIHNPVLLNETTGEEISIVLNMNVNDVFIITTGFGNKTAVYTPAGGGPAQNGFQYLSADSVFWQLAIGENNVSLSYSAAAAGSYASIEWFDRFIGV